MGRSPRLCLSGQIAKFSKIALTKLLRGGAPLSRKPLRGNDLRQFSEPGVVKVGKTGRLGCLGPTGRIAVMEIVSESLNRKEKRWRNHLDFADT